jgi:hypothetical protein
MLSESFPSPIPILIAFSFSDDIRNFYIVLNVSCILQATHSLCYKNGLSFGNLPHHCCGSNAIKTHQCTRIAPKLKFSSKKKKCP